MAIDETLARTHEPIPPLRIQEPNRAKIMLIVAYDDQGTIINMLYLTMETSTLLHIARASGIARVWKRQNILRDNSPYILNNSVICHIAGAVTTKWYVKFWETC